MPHILLIDDDTELTSLLSEVLSFEGFTVSEANDGEAGLAALSEEVDLILLDVMMPKLNGMETLKRLREDWDTPVLMLTAKGEEIDRVIGLELEQTTIYQNLSVTVNYWRVFEPSYAAPNQSPRRKCATTCNIRTSKFTQANWKPTATNNCLS